MSQRLTLLGLCAMGFYGVMLATGTLSVEVMPQFVVSALIFLTSGRLLRRSAQARSNEEETSEEATPKVEADWPWLTGLLNWSAALLIIGALAILIMKPAGVSFTDALKKSDAHAHYFSTAVP